MFFNSTNNENLAAHAECNRTYYGNVGLTYDLELHRPKEDKIPYVCVLKFTAAGGQQGDIVQVGKYTTTITLITRPPVPGEARPMQ